MVSKSISRWIGTLARKRTVLLLCGGALLLWILSSPYAALGLWLTPDQQGRLLFQLERYNEAARRFDDPRWRAMSLYAAQDFKASAQAFSQFQDAAGLLGRANALAHSREYLAARDAYEELARRFPEHPAPGVNLPLIQSLIDANRQLSESQQSESGDMSSEQNEGPQSSEGDARISLLPREQLTAEALQNPEIKAMWLRQVQRNPAEFLSTKFYLQLERAEAAPNE